MTVVGVMHSNVKDGGTAPADTIAQYGIAIPLAQDLFTGKQTPIIHIHPNTGNIQSIQR